MTSDFVIYALISIALIGAFFVKRARLPVSMVALSLICDYAAFRLFDSYLYSGSLYNWALLIAGKDFIVMLVLFMRGEIKEYPIAWCFLISSLLHQIIAIQTDNYVLTLLNLRPDIMNILSASILASLALIFLARSDSNGGKRVKYRLFSADSRFNSIFYTKAHKAIQ